MLKTGSDFSGVGAFDQALIRLNLKYETVFACDIDKYARQSYIANYGQPKYYPENVYKREIPKKSLDIYMTSPPCQSFSFAGKRGGENDDRGMLFYNSHEFIIKNKPRFFIFENVKGLLSDSKGKTFANWVAMLGGKSVNGNPNIFPLKDAAPYHIYHRVLNAKDFGVPQNRERIFIIGVRDDKDNHFTWPKKEHLKTRLKSVLEKDVDKKYFLSEKMVKGFIAKRTNGFKGKFKPTKGEKHANTITTKTGGRRTDNYIYDSGNINQDTQGSKVHSKNKVAPTIISGTHGYANGYIIGAIRGRNKENPKSRKTNIRKLTPRECFRLMDFPDSFKFVVSNTQLYKQAGNSIVVGLLSKIINKLKL